MNKTIFIKARDLAIKHGDNPLHWQWFAINNGDEVAKLVGIKELDIKGEIKTFQLIHNPAAVYIVFKLEEDHENIDFAFAAVGTYDKTKSHPIALASNPHRRKDHWYEAALGVDFKFGNEPRFRLWGIDDFSYKYGIIVKGFEIRVNP